MVYTGRDGCLREQTVRAGVPQGSILGPLLWILVFNYVLELKLPEGCELVCYADDTLLFAHGDTLAETLTRARLAASLVLTRIEELGLIVSVDKMEAIWFHGGRLIGAPSSLYLRDREVRFRKTLKYLGVLFDGHATFKSHFELVERKAASVTRALGRLMPNLRGPCEARRRLYSNCIHSVILYAAPVWSESFGLRAAYRRSLSSLQRNVALRVARGYRTVSFVAATLLARIPPLPLLADKRRRIYERIREERLYGTYSPARRGEIEAAADILLSRHWLNFASNDSLPGRRVANAILPCMEAWIHRPHGSITHHATQILTGHGVFAEYLHRIGRADNPECWLCEAPIDDADHTLLACPAFEVYRVYLASVLGEELSLSGVVAAAARDENVWKAFMNFCRWTMEEKASVEREREREAVRRDRERDVRVMAEASGDDLVLNRTSSE